MRLRIDPWVGKIPWRKIWQLTLVSLPGESHEQRSLGDAVDGVTKRWTGLRQLSTFTCLGTKVVRERRIISIIPAHSKNNKE